MIIAIKTDEGVAIMRISPDKNGDLHSPEIEVAKWSEGSGIAAVSWQEINEADPPDETFREAWEFHGGINVNMFKAKQMHMDRIRKARDARLAELDKRKYGAEYDAERQALRDLPQTFDLSGAKTPEELKQLWPEI